MIKEIIEQSLPTISSRSEKLKVRVLIVDANKSSSDLVKLCLELQEPFKIETAQSVEEAIKKVLNAPFDVIVSEYEMTIKDGLQFFEELKTNSIYVPFILFTGRSNEEIVVKALNSGVYRFINKHGGPEAVYMELASAIRQAAAYAKSIQMLKKSEERFRQLAENAGIWIWETDQNGLFTYASSEVEKLLGYTPKEIIGKVYYNFYPPQEKEIFKLNSTRIFAKKLPFRKFLAKYIHKNGKIVWMSSSGIPTFDEKGCLLGYKGADADVTDQIKVKEKLVNSEQKYRHLFEDNLNTMYIHDLKGKILSVNNSVEGYGLKKEQVIGKSLLKFVPKKYWTQLSLEIIRLSRGRFTEGEVEIITPMGNRLAEYRSTPIIDGNKVTSAVAVLRDITDKKKTEEALLENQQKFKALFTANPEASVFLDTNFVVIEGNSQFTKMFGYSPEEIIGKSIVNLLVPREAEEESENLRKKLVQCPVEIITRRKRKDGTLVPLFMSGSPIKVNKKVIGIVIVYKDISDVIIAQEELTKALNRAELLNEKLGVIGGFTRHDVRNKLMGITGNVYLAEKYAGENDRLRASLNRIKVSTGNIISILNFAKDFEMLGSQELSDIDIGKSVDEAIGLLGKLRRVKVINECHGLTVRADEMLTTIFHNLLENSLKYGQTLTEIRIWTEQKKGFMKIIYQDNGVGIEKEVKNNLFSKGVGRGTGFGLYLIKRTCEIYGWTIKETARLGKGVRFEFNIPTKNDT